MPTDRPTAHAAGSDVDRVLLMGNGIAVSYGVLSHDQGLAGHLARGLSALTGRGTTVDVRAAPDLTPADALPVLASPEFAKYDAVVSTLGGLEAVLFGSADLWRHSVRELIETLARWAPNTSIHFVGIPLASNMVRMPRVYGLAVDAHTDRLNSITEQVCAEYPSASFIPFEPVQARVLDQIGRDLYKRWADQIANNVAHRLDSRVHRETIPTDEDARLAALVEMGILDSPRDEELDQIVTTARDLFGASGAGVNLIDSDRQWVMSSAGRSQGNICRGDSVCTTTITAADVFIIEDIHLDPAYRDKDWAHGDDAVRFYAGYPIEAPDGYRIGALCVVDDKPRSFEATDRALLRELAMRVQALLWEKRSTLATPSHSE
ncbi:MAG: GAF domain-containing protein [Actinobacteria bacterium]|nr:GAF domain-containing protein [Actinomycetota bacterium]